MNRSRLLFALFLLAQCLLPGRGFASSSMPYKCSYNDEPVENVRGTALGEKNGFAYEDLKWLKTGRRLIFSFPAKPVRVYDTQIDQYGRAWKYVDLGRGSFEMISQNGDKIKC